jgi:hypothetical protein
MKAKVLKTERDYQTALAYVERLIEQSSPDEAELELWSLLVETYEESHFPIATPRPHRGHPFPHGSSRPATRRPASLLTEQEQDFRSHEPETTAELVHDSRAAYWPENSRRRAHAGIDCVHNSPTPIHPATQIRPPHPTGRCLARTYSHDQSRNLGRTSATLAAGPRRNSGTTPSTGLSASPSRRGSSYWHNFHLTSTLAKNTALTSSRSTRDSLPEVPHHFAHERRPSHRDWSSHSCRKTAARGRTLGRNRRQRRSAPDPRLAPLSSQRRPGTLSGESHRGVALAGSEGPPPPPVVSARLIVAPTAEADLHENFTWYEEAFARPRPRISSPASKRN